MDVALYDTTLRDGCQQAGITFSATDKLRIVEKLDELGIHYIEGGWPGSNPKDIEFFGQAKRLRLRNSKLVAFGSTRRAHTPVEEDKQIEQLLRADTEFVTIVGKSWDTHVVKAMKISLDENLSMIRDSVGYLSSMGRKVIFDAEHFFEGFRGNQGYAIKCLMAAIEASAFCVVLCDTNGGTLPFELAEILKEVRRMVPGRLGFHAHNDCGVAVANSLIAAREGVGLIQGTMNGYGERCGNANLCTIIPNLKLKLGLEVVSDEALQKLTSVSRFVDELANVTHDESQPYVGQNAFTHKAGIHVNALPDHKESYEHVDPQLVGNSRRILVSELSGKSNLLQKLGGKGARLAKDRRELTALLERIKKLEHEGYQFEGAEGSFELLVRKTFNTYENLFTLLGFRIIVEKRDSGEAYSEATIKVRVGNRVVHTAAEGNGPVNALDNALRKALEEVYPALKRIKLADYKVRVLEGRDGTGAKVRVLIESRDDHRSWGTVGVSTNIIEASWEALVDSIEYGLSTMDDAGVSAGSEGSVNGNESVGHD